MPVYTGSLRDLVGASMANRQCELVFSPNEAMLQVATTTPGTIHPTAEIRVKPSANGNFSVNLTATTVMLTDCFYLLRIEWVDKGVPPKDFPNWQLRVPVGSGGHIGEIITVGPPHGGWGGSLANLSLVLVSPTRPKGLQRGQLWLQAVPGEHASPDEKLNTGILWRGI